MGNAKHCCVWGREGHSELGLLLVFFSVGGSLLSKVWSGDIGVITELCGSWLFCVLSSRILVVALSGNSSVSLGQCQVHFLSTICCFIS